MAKRSYDEAMRYIHRFAKQHQLTTTWELIDNWNSVDFTEEHPDHIEGMSIVYLDVEVEIRGPTWGDLYIAADQAINESGDKDHTYIEVLCLDPDNRSFSMWCRN